MMFKAYVKNDLLISTDPSKLDHQVIHHFLKEAYWAENLPYEVLRTAIDNSLCFGVYHRHKQIGFARVVTDFSTIAYIADIFILDAYKEKGILDWLLECILAYPDLQVLKRWLLASKDGLYAKFKFLPLQHPENLMEMQSVQIKTKPLTNPPDFHE